SSTLLVLVVGGRRARHPRGARHGDPCLRRSKSSTLHVTSYYRSTALTGGTAPARPSRMPGNLRRRAARHKSDQLYGLLRGALLGRFARRIEVPPHVQSEIGAVRRKRSCHLQHLRPRARPAQRSKGFLHREIAFGPHVGIVEEKDRGHI